MEYTHRGSLVPVRKHVGRPGPWSQLPMLLLGMMFVAALLLSGYERTSTGPSVDIANPAGSTGGSDVPAARR